MGCNAVQVGIGILLLAHIVDRWIGDPPQLIHPVVVMGWAIQRLRQIAEGWSRGSRVALRLSGGLITLVIVGGSALLGWCLEQAFLESCASGHPARAAVGAIVLVIASASCLAAQSLQQAVLKVLEGIQTNDIQAARHNLQWIVGRETKELEERDILRAAAETAAENSVDAVFAPLFWMTVGLFVWHCDPSWPGPLAMAWAFKATSTLDSMVGYKTGTLLWLGTTSARLDDALVWLPCRCVMATLPLVAAGWNQWWSLVRSAEKDGQADPSPNSGRAEAIYAHCTKMCLGGPNRYGEQWVVKPTLGATMPDPSRSTILHIFRLNTRLQIAWIAVAALVLHQASL